MGLLENIHNGNTFSRAWIQLSVSVPNNFGIREILMLGNTLLFVMLINELCRGLSVASAP